MLNQLVENHSRISKATYGESYSMFGPNSIRICELDISSGTASLSFVAAELLLYMHIRKIQSGKCPRLDSPFHACRNTMYANYLHLLCKYYIVVPYGVLDLRR